MTRYATLLTAALLQGCAGVTTFDVSVGANVTSHTPWSQGRDGGFKGPSEVVQFAVRHQRHNCVYVELRHVSHLSAGWPLNERAEDWLDVVSVGCRFQVER